MLDEQLLSHNIINETQDTTIQKISARIRSEGDKRYVTVDRQLELLKQLNEFDFGQFILQNQGLNGYWTHYILTHPWLGRVSGKNHRGESFSEMEKFLLDRAPTTLATQQRFKIFLQENQKQVTNDAKLACIPCGMMGELLYLDFDKISHIQLVGIDYDKNVLTDAATLAKKQNLSKFISLRQENAWEMKYRDEFDLISSHGLNIYELNNKKVMDLYHVFFNALKPGGKLVTSFLTCPPTVTNTSEWDLTRVNHADLTLQKIIFSDIIDAKWQSFRTSEQTKTQLQYVGFTDIDFIYDEARIFPTVVAYKP